MAFGKDKEKEAALVIAFDKARKGKDESEKSDAFDAGSRDPMEEDSSSGDMDSILGSLGDAAVEAAESGDGLEFAKAVLRMIHAHQDGCDEDCPGHAEGSDHGEY
jgi:hypothetical protein